VDRQARACAPSEVRALSTLLPTASPSPEAISHEVGCPAECCMRAARDSSGSSRPLRPRRFRRDRRVHRAPSTTRFRKWLHPLVSFAPLQSYASQPAPALVTQERLPWGSRFPLRGMNRRTSRGEFPGSPPSAHGVSHALDGLLRIRSRGFVSPHCHVQGSPSRGFCLACSRATSSVARALSSLASLRCRRLPDGATCARVAHRALLRTRIRDRRSGV
jgi:hypothetical protein